MFILHLAVIKTGWTSSTEKKQGTYEEKEKRMKAVLSWFGNRCGAFEIPYSLIGVYCKARSAFPDKINMLVDRFEIGTVFLGNPKDAFDSKILRANVFRINRRMGFVYDKTFLKQSIIGCDITQISSYEEGISRYEAKLETDYVEYRFLKPQYYSEFDRAVIVAETRGQPVPTEPVFEQKEEKERRLPSEFPVVDKIPEKAESDKKRVHRKSPPSSQKTSDTKKEKARDAEKIPIKDTSNV